MFYSSIEKIRSHHTRVDVRIFSAAICNPVQFNRTARSSTFSYSLFRAVNPRQISQIRLSIVNQYHCNLATRQHAFVYTFVYAFNGRPCCPLQFFSLANK